MAAFADTPVLAAETWTELTDSDTTNFTVQNQTSSALYLKVTTGVAPTTLAGAALYAPGLGDQRAIADLFPGVTGGDRLWAYSVGGGPVMIQHD